MTKRLRNNKGIALITAYIAISTVITLSVGFTFSAVTELAQARRYRDSAQAFWAAEAGRNKAIQKLRNNETIGNTGEKYRDLLPTINGEKYSVEVSGGGGTYTITSTGTENNISRRIEQTVTIYSLSPWSDANDDPSNPFNYALFGNSGEMSIKQNGTVVGSIFQYGDVELRQNSNISDYVYATGTITARQNVSYTAGTLPDALPSIPMLSLDISAYFGDSFSDAIAYANTNGASGDQTYLAVNLTEYENNTLYVNGNITIDSGIGVVGPGVIVATGNIEIKQSGHVDQDITLIAAGNIKTEQNSSIGKGATFIAGGNIQTGQNSAVGDNATLVSAGQLEIDTHG